MDRPKEILSPDERDASGSRGGSEDADASSPAKYCEDCGVEVHGHGWDRIHGVYYCHACYRRRRSLSKLKHAAVRIIGSLLALLALSALILLALWFFERLHFFF